MTTKNKRKKFSQKKTKKSKRKKKMTMVRKNKKKMESRRVKMGMEATMRKKKNKMIS